MPCTCFNSRKLESVTDNKEQSRISYLLACYKRIESFTMGESVVGSFQTIITVKGAINELQMAEFLEVRMPEWRKHRKKVKILLIGGTHGSRDGSLAGDAENIAILHKVVCKSSFSFLYFFYIHF